ncbi:unnamed protein product, partial [Laminaria digitata]
MSRTRTAAAELEGSLDENVTPPTITGVRPHSRTTVMCTAGVDGATLDAPLVAAAPDTTDSEGRNKDARITLPKGLEDDLEEGVGTEPEPGEEKDGAAVVKPEAVIGPVGLSSSEPAVDTCAAGASESEPVFAEAATFEPGGSQAEKSERLEAPYVEMLIEAMDKVMKGWCGQQIPDVLKGLKAFH